MMIPKFGFTTDPSKDIVKGINLLGILGFDFVEVSFQEPLTTPSALNKKKKEIKEALDKYKLMLAVHTPWWNDLGTLHENVRKGWVHEIKGMLDFGNELGLKKMNIHPNFHKVNTVSHKGKETSINNNVQSLMEIADHAANYNIIIVVENNLTTFSPIGFHEYEEIVNRAKNVKITVDIGHAFVEGGMEQILKYIKTFKKRLNHMHFHDNHGENDEHLPLGVALIDYNRVVNELKKINYVETITLEVFVPDNSFQKDSMDILKRLWKG